jgi:hypothetical protein
MSESVRVHIAEHDGDDFVTITSGVEQ